MKRTSVYGLFRAFIVTCLLALPISVSANVVKLTSGEWQPYISKSLKEGGFVTQLVKEAFESQGYTVEFVYMPWKRSYEEAKSGLYDGSIV